MSKGFNFTLQKVLDVRTIVEDKKAAILRKAHAETELERKKLAAIQAEKRSIAQVEPGEEDTAPSLQSLNTRSAYMDQLTHEIEDQSRQVDASELRAARKRDEFIKATKDKMVLEKLKDTHKENYRKKANQAEIKIDSEVASRVVQRERNS